MQQMIIMVIVYSKICPVKPFLKFLLILSQKHSDLHQATMKMDLERYGNFSELRESFISLKKPCLNNFTFSNRNCKVEGTDTDVVKRVPSFTIERLLSEDPKSFNIDRTGRSLTFTERNIFGSTQPEASDQYNQKPAALSLPSPASSTKEQPRPPSEGGPGAPPAPPLSYEWLRCTRYRPPRLPRE